MPGRQTALASALFAPDQTRKIASKPDRARQIRNQALPPPPSPSSNLHSRRSASRDFVPWRFSDAGKKRASSSAPQRCPRNLHKRRHATGRSLAVSDNSLLRKPDRRICPNSDLALDLKSTAMQLCQQFHQGQSQPCTLIASVQSTVDLTECGHCFRYVLGGDAYPVICHGNSQSTIFLQITTHSNFSTRFSEFHRVGQQVDQHLPKLPLICS